MEQPKRIVAVFSGIGLTLALLAFGLSLTGTRARALGLLPSPVAGGLAAMPGSSRASGELLLNGVPTAVLVCQTPRSAGEVLEHYHRVARGETPDELPFLFQEGSDGSGALLWVTREGAHRSVLVEPSANGRTTYRLIDDQPGPQERAQQLPGGIAAPAGFRVEYALGQRDGTGMALLEAEGPCRDVAGRLLAPLERRGFTADRQRLRALPEDPDGRVTIPLRHTEGALDGEIIVSPAPEGARACLSIRPADAGAHRR